MANTSSLLELANTIYSQVAAIHGHLAASGQEDLAGFDAHAALPNYKGIDDTRAEVLANLIKLQDLLSTPHELLRTSTATDFLSRHAIDRLGILDVVPVGETRTYPEIAEQTKVPVKTIRRLLRHAMTQRIFHEPRPGVVAHTQVSRLLAEDIQIRDYNGTICEEVWPAATRTVDAIQTWPGSAERNETGYFLAHGRTIYETLDQDPVKHKRYDSAMGAFSDDRSSSLGHVIKGYDWSALHKATVVDVGGGSGSVSKALAKAFPLLNFVVEDQPDVIANTELEGVESDARQRIRFLAHDFFEDQPIKHAEVYFIRRVLMEWSDEQGVLILKALIPALKIGARVLIQDFYVPDPGSCLIWQERRFRNSDMLSIVVANGSPREAEEWQNLFEKASAGFDFQGIKPVADSDVVFIEAVWRGEV